MAYLWAWYFLAIQWRQEQKLKELEKDSLDKSLAEALDALMDRWLICSQWAGVWAFASAPTVSGYASGLAGCIKQLAQQPDVGSAVTVLRQHLQSQVQDIEQGAVNGLITRSADDRQQVRIYYTALWIWNQLDQNRWEKAKVSLRQHGRLEGKLDVDHIVAWELWQSKLSSGQAEPPKTDGDDKKPTDDELSSSVNELGNCMLLKKNFNLSKSKQPLIEFLNKVHEFKEGKLTITDWAEALDLDMAQVDSANTPVEDLYKLFNARTKKILADLEQFVRGTKERVDVGSN
jgi:hypothetical protein